MSTLLFKESWSLRRRLLVQLSIGFAILAFALFLSVRFVASSSASLTQDTLLGASATSISQEIRIVNGKPFVDLPYSALATLGVAGNDRVFYSVRHLEGTLLTGYEGLIEDVKPKVATKPQFLTSEYQAVEIRAAVLNRTLFHQGQRFELVVTVAQTRDAYHQLTDSIALSAAAAGAGFFVIAGLLGMIAISNALSPLRVIGEALAKRETNDFSPIEASSPTEVKPLIDALNAFIVQLRTTFETSEQFILEAAHRIRTPLAAVSAQTELAHRAARSDAMRKRLARALRSARQTTRVTTQLLNQAMITYRSTRAPIEEVSLETVIKAAIHDLDAAADLRAMDFDIEIEPDLTLFGDEIALTEAIRNLVDNAIKYGPEGGDIMIKAVGLTVDTIQLTIEDQGPGIAEEEIGHVVGRFSRGSNVGRIVGSGLGLSIVRQVVSTHGGDMFLEKAAGGGLSVRLTLRRHRRLNMIGIIR